MFFFLGKEIKFTWKEKAFKHLTEFWVVSPNALKFETIWTRIGPTWQILVKMTPKFN